MENVDAAVILETGSNNTNYLRVPNPNLCVGKENKMPKVEN